MSSKLGKSLTEMSEHETCGEVKKHAAVGIERKDSISIEEQALLMTGCRKKVVKSVEEKMRLMKSKIVEPNSPPDTTSDVQNAKRWMRLKMLVSPDCLNRFSVHPGIIIFPQII
jgi:hypothetical protein